MSESGQVPVNETPETVKDAHESIVVFLHSYGWFLLVGVGVLLYFRSRIEQTFNRWRSSQDQAADDHKYDSESVLSRQQAMEANRRQLQERFDAQAALYAEEAKKKEEEKRKQRIEDWDRHLEGKGYRSKYKPQEEEQAASSASSRPRKKPTYRTSDYNPLMGDPRGSSYRPDRRGGAAGGGG